jgi:hypothetical protein
MANLEMTPAEVVALVQLIGLADTHNVLVMNDKGEMEMFDTMEAANSVTNKINDLGLDPEVKTYMEERFGPNDDSENVESDTDDATNDSDDDRNAQN